ncbi:MAG: sulfotransferase [Myxococcota bacterium]
MYANIDSLQTLRSPTSNHRQPRPLPLWARGPHGVHLSEVPVRAGGGRPNFIVIGAAKAGTTSLHRYLDGHPELSMCPYKEPHFFSTDVIYERVMAWYEGLFADCDESTLCGEASTSYTFGPQAAQAPARIRAHVPDAKLIYLMREPVARLHSEVMQGIKYSQHVLGQTELPRSVQEVILANLSTLHAGRYIEQIERYLGVFPREQLMVVLHEDLVSAPRATLARIFAFLGSTRAIGSTRASATTSPRVMCRVVRTSSSLRGGDASCPATTGYDRCCQTRSRTRSSRCYAEGSGRGRWSGRSTRGKQPSSAPTIDPTTAGWRRSWAGI